MRDFSANNPRKREQRAIMMLARIVLATLCAVAAFCLCNCQGVRSYAEKVVHERLDSLKVVAEKFSTKVECGVGTYLYINNDHFGNTGNHMISLTHGLWIARKLNAVFIVPPWMGETMHHFNLTTLSQHHCFSIDGKVPRYSKNYEMTSEESFFIYKLFNDGAKPFKALLPPLNDEVVEDISRMFISVYTSLWSAPKPVIVTSAIWIIENYLGGNLNFTTVHKRNLDGECADIMREVAKASDFSPTEIPMDSPAWAGDHRVVNPLCEMPLDFVKKTMAMNGRGESNLFVAFDGQGDVSSYRMHRAVFSTVMESHPEYRFIPMKYVDMLVAMMGDFFIQNPRSTFSFQVLLTRICFGLQSVPAQIKNDVYFQKVPDMLNAEHRPMWVSWSSLHAAYHKVMS